MQRGLIARIFIASPSDVMEERNEACSVIGEWNAANSLTRSVILEPVRVETHSQVTQGAHPQDLINGQLLERCDLLLAILWSKIGTPTLKDASGTIQEIREFAELKGHDKVLLFFCNRNFPYSTETSQIDAVKQFKNSVKDKGLYREFESVPDFARAFRQQLDITMNGLIPSEEGQQDLAAETKEVTLSPEACTLLIAASLESRGTITNSRSSSGHQVAANRVCYSQGNDGRSESRWEGAIELLEQYSYIEDLGYKREVFKLKAEGFEAADKLWYVLLLKRVEMLQNHEHSYVNIEDLTKEKYLSQSPSIGFLREKAMFLQSVENIETVLASSEIAAVRLTGLGRKTIREHAWLEFAESDLIAS
jgi:hypothetical protein